MKVDGAVHGLFAQAGITKRLTVKTHGTI